MYIIAIKCDGIVYIKIIVLHNTECKEKGDSCESIVVSDLS